IRDFHVTGVQTYALPISTGVRVGELVGANLEDVDLDAHTLRVTGKGSRERVVPFGIPAARALRAWLDRGRPRLIGPRSGAALFRSEERRVGEERRACQRT